MPNGVRAARLEDIDLIAANMRQDDAMECRARGHEPRESLVAGYAISSIALTVSLHDGTPIAMFGVVNSGVDVGACWLLGTPAIEKHRIEFLRNSRKWIDVLHAQYPTLWSWVDVRNSLHLRWLKWLGFEQSGSANIGVNGELFHMVIKHKD